MNTHTIFFENIPARRKIWFDHSYDAVFLSLSLSLPSSLCLFLFLFRTEASLLVITLQFLSRDFCFSSAYRLWGAIWGAWRAAVFINFASPDYLIASLLSFLSDSPLFLLPALQNELLQQMGIRTLHSSLTSRSYPCSPLLASSLHPPPFSSLSRQAYEKIACLT